MHRWLKPCVIQRGTAPGSAAIHIHRGEVLNALTAAGTPYSLANLKTVCAVPGASADFRSDFGNKQRELSIKIPRDEVDEDNLKVIDSCK